MEKQKVKILLYSIAFLCICLNSSQAQPIKCLTTEVYRPDSLHTPMTTLFPNGARLPFLGDTIQNIQVVNGMVIYGGDIVLGKYADLTSNGGIYHLPDSAFLWTCNVIPYTITGFSTDEEFIIQQAIKYVNRKTHLYWKLRTGESCYVQFVKKANSYGTQVGCSCKTNNKAHIIELEANPAFGKIVHEMTHTMGLYHEHERYDRPNSVVINMANIMPAYKSNFIIQKYPPTYLTALNGVMFNGISLQAYDYESIMHYNQYAFSLIPRLKGLPRIIPLESISTAHNIGQRIGYTVRDTAKINTLYPNGIEQTGQNQYKMVYLDSNKLPVSATIVYGFVAHHNDPLPAPVLSGTTNTTFPITPSATAPILKVIVTGGCTFYEDLY